MTHDDYRMLIFQVVEHHLDRLDDCSSHEDVDYHADRIRWAVEYLKRFTVATPIERRPPDGGCENVGLAQIASSFDGKTDLEKFNTGSKINTHHIIDDDEL